jgi:hypothetical protein
MRNLEPGVPRSGILRRYLHDPPGPPVAILYSSIQPKKSQALFQRVEASMRPAPSAWFALGTEGTTA